MKPNMVARIILIFQFILICGRINAQVVSTVPAFPTAEDSVTVIFDASLGNAGLAGYTGDIWAHTGVITDKSTSSTDWKYVIAGWSQNTDKAKLRSLGNNKWELKIRPSVRSFYGVPSGEKILKMAFVFRNNNGSKTGRMADGSDIFATIYEAGLNLTLTSPDQDFLVANQGSTISIAAQATSSDSIAVFQDALRLYSVAGLVLNYSLSVPTSGFHNVEVVAYGLGTTVTKSFSYLVRGDNPVAELPAGAKDGINYPSDHEATLVLYAPNKEFAFAVGDFSDWKIDPLFRMNRTPDGFRYWITLDNLESGREYRFQYLVDGTLRIADPYSNKISDPWNDHYISESTYPNLIDYPAGKTTEAVSVLQTGQVPYNWKHPEFTPPEKKNLVIYELLVRDFLEAHSFNVLIDTLDYLKNLGITAIELMPVSEFEGNDSWGYNPSFYFAVDKYYGPAETFKAFVDSAHARGLAVIMDMVLNHSYGQSPLVRLYWDGANNRPSAENPWYNPVSPNSTYSWGYDFNHQSAATQRFVDSVNTYWLKEYKVDGFRFDFTKGFTNTTGDGGSYDASRIAILKRMAGKIWEANPNAYIILEHFTATQEEKELTDFGMMVWGNVNYNYRQATSGWYSGGGWDFSGISYLNRGFSQPGVVGYMESHDEERLMYECLRYGNTQNQAYNLKDLGIALKRMELGANFFIPVPGPKMIWMFGELGYDYSINYNNDRVGRKPIRWDYLSDPLRKRLYQVYGALNELKASHPVFATSDFQISFQDSVKRLHLNHPDMKVTILGNFGIRTSSRAGNFQHTGWWYEYWTGDSVQIQATTSQVTLAPGEYRLYTDKKLKKPDILSSSGDFEISEIEDAGILYPNPAHDILNLWLNGSGRWNITISDVSGRRLMEEAVNGNSTGGQHSFRIGNLQPGIYFLEARSGNQRTIRKFVKE
jgi:hypothetical protein